MSSTTKALDAASSLAQSAVSISPAVFDDVILELLPSGAYVCDADGTIVRYNRKAVEIWGLTPEGGHSVQYFSEKFRLFRSDGRPMSYDRAPMAEALRTGRPARDVEVGIGRPDGSRIYVLVNIEPLKDVDGQVIGAIGCFQDITIRKEAEMRAREGEELFRAVVNTTPEAVKIVSADGTLLYMNPAGMRMFESDGKDLFGTMTTDRIAPEHRERWERQHERVCKGGESLSWEFDLISMRGNRRHMETHAVPLNMPDGSVARLAVTRDITQRKRDEAALRESERQMHALIEAMPVAVYTTDVDGRLTFYNQAAVDLWGMAPRLGRDQWCGAWRLYWPNNEPLRHDECPMATALRENRALVAAEAMAQRPDGTKVPFMAYPTPLHNSAGEMIGAVNMLVDITQRKQAEERQQLLINELNHRVKNMLATVQSIAAQSLTGSADRSASRWFMDRLMALSRAHDVLTREKWEGVGLYDVVTQAVAPLCGRDQSRFDISGPDLALKPKKAVSLVMSLHELCTNAAKYGALSNDSGHVTITWYVVRNNGEKRFHLRWWEVGGPPVEPPKRKGFGTRLIEQGLVHDLEADVRLDFHVQGIMCDIEAIFP